MAGAAVIVLVAFAVMEPVTYLTHRFVMHGVGMVLHRSHHRRWPERREGDPFFEANDGFPVIFAGIVVSALALGFNDPDLAGLLPVCAGVTLYGAAYAFVHDGYIHGRLPVRFRSRWLDHLAWAHSLHHRFGGEPYGMLAPVVPASVRAKEAARQRRLASAAAGSDVVERTSAIPRP